MTRNPAGREGNLRESRAFFSELSPRFGVRILYVHVQPRTTSTTRIAILTGHDIAMGLRSAYLAMHRRGDAFFARHGVTADQFVLLALLDDRDGITQQELVRRASSDPNTVRAMLLLLEGRGLVARRRHPTDGRARCVTLTSKGRRAFDRLWASNQPFQDRLVALFRPDEAKALIEFLARISGAMTQPKLSAISHQLSGIRRLKADDREPASL
jgi:DNA-binding MarR family transcriptional regulator